MASKCECPICGVEFKSVDACARHVDECHPPTSPTTPKVSSTGHASMSPTRQRVSGGHSSKMTVSRRLFDDDDIVVSGGGRCIAVGDDGMKCNKRTEPGSPYCKAHQWISNLPKTMDGAEFRSKSQTQIRAKDKHRWQLRQKKVTRSAQQKCHRVTNEMLLEIYNETEDPVLKAELIQFNYSWANIFDGEKNKDHSRMENGFKKDDILRNDFSRKRDMLVTALKKAMADKKMRFSTRLIKTILEKMASTSSSYREVVASLDQRKFNDPELKSVIKGVREKVKKEEKKPSMSKAPSANARKKGGSDEKPERSEWKKFYAKHKKLGMTRTEIKKLWHDKKRETNDDAASKHSGHQSVSKWNDFQRRAKGLSREEMKVMYKSGKTSDAEINSALRKKKRAEQEKSDAAMARAPKAAPSPSTSSSGRSNAWNDFQRRSKGLSREQKKSMYRNGMTSDADIQRALGRSSVAAPSRPSAPSNAWNDFQRRSKGLSREQKKSMYRSGMTSDVDIQRALGRSSVAAPSPPYGFGGFGGGSFGGGGFGGFGGGGFGGGGFGGGGRPSGTHHSRGSANGRQIFTGPRGGRYYINGNGNKTYL